MRTKTNAGFIHQDWYTDLPQLKGYPDTIYPSFNTYDQSAR